ncbi:cupin domain-containing protein [Niabella ginsengisoli]|uniref:Cupin domain-containing protein n=1 Tax=Niabella ginsengisoli TaxID=522298 RepID=A0ABS9SGF2_9BACT|nr:cupin domain-containing protein [Niabella ginsengisoli]MCH5597396.1 cupin domain-containing protein [Niabella ginsengisoli]
MQGFHTNIESLTIENNNFRKVLYTASHMQLVLMSLLPGEEIGEEIHNENDQFFRFEQGEGKCIIDGNEYAVKDGSAIIIPSGAKHNVINTGNTALKMYTIYAPPHHKDGIVRSTKKKPKKMRKILTGKQQNNIKPNACKCFDKLSSLF